ncbi:hypothetical protein COLO4_27186 [Corchorus olitorius]|uniref:Uncharacterized protein n=1 Tax=Corchorus olitorius TaxID=93759 RepID=A0A1R3HS86_9ROSI|nr:hypothetical protein COLO4_27186 [Corchorus olitorius]
MAQTTVNFGSRTFFDEFQPFNHFDSRKNSSFRQVIHVKGKLD